MSAKALLAEVSKDPLLRIVAGLQWREVKPLLAKHLDENLGLRLRQKRQQKELAVLIQFCLGLTMESASCITLVTGSTNSAI